MPRRVRAPSSRPVCGDRPALNQRPNFGFYGVNLAESPRALHAFELHFSNVPSLGFRPLWATGKAKYNRDPATTNAGSASDKCQDDGK